MAKVILKNITLLKTFFGVYLLILLAFTMHNYTASTISSGWLIIGILGATVIGIMGLVVGFITPLLTRNRRQLFFIELFILLCFCMLFYLYLIP